MSPAAPSQTDLWLEWDPVTVPSAVDQAAWVVRLDDESLRILEQERWIAPLRDEIRAALSERLAQNVGAVDARQAPESLRGTGARYRVRVDILRFELLLGQGAWLESAWTIDTLGAQGKHLRCTRSWREGAGRDLPSLAQAQRRAIQALADAMGQSLQQLRAAESVPGCGTTLSPPR